MPISIICPGCHGRFQVSEKFAGKQGPCPKCKALINIPKLEDEVKIHAPAESGGIKDSKGRPVLKPIERKATKFSTTLVTAIGASVLVTVGVAWIVGKASSQETGQADISPLILGVGALALSIPLVLGGYSVLRNDELESYTGNELWIRAALCGVCYAALWGAYALLSAYRVIPEEQNAQVWMFVGPPFVLAGASVAFLSLDLEFSSAALHFAFYLIVCVLLRLVMGLNAV